MSAATANAAKEKHLSLKDYIVRMFFLKNGSGEPETLKIDFLLSKWSLKSYFLIIVLLIKTVHHIYIYVFFKCDK